MNKPIKVPSRHFSINNNVSFIVRDADTGRIRKIRQGHNSATNSILTGLGHYLTGDGILNQGWHLLKEYVPQYISLGTMGLYSQEANAEGLPIGIGVGPGDEIQGYKDYLLQTPGYGADGYDANINNSRPYFGLGPMFKDRKAPILPETGLIGDINQDGKVDMEDFLMLVDYNCGNITLTPKAQKAADINGDGVINCDDVELLKNYVQNEDPDKGDLGSYEYWAQGLPTVNCELISDSFPRAKISYREIVPEMEAEFPQTIDVVFSAMISTGALAQFREPGRDYIFITEAGLWSTPKWTDSGENGLLAGYRLAPTDQRYWGMDEQSVTDGVAMMVLAEQGVTNPTAQQIQNIKPTIAADNRNRLQRQILRVGVNQVVQVIWKIQLGGLEQLQNINSIYQATNDLYWYFWD